MHKPNAKLMIHLAANATLLALFTPAAMAAGFDPSGLRPPQCDQYQLKSPVNYVKGKATSADSGEYTFTAKMSEGQIDKDCSGSDQLGIYTATIDARWDGATKHAYETIHHQPPAQGKMTEIDSICPENPWTAKSNPDCKLVAVKADNKRMIEPAIAGPYPVSAYRIGYKGRQQIAETAFWVGSNDFILPPQLPPSFRYGSSGNMDGLFLKRNQDIPITVLRPTDGSPEWYTSNLKSYDIELQAETNTIGSNKYAPSTGWTNNKVITHVAADAPTFTLPYNKLFTDPSENWITHDYSPRGVCRNFRIRVRIHDDVTARPWSSWEVFFVEIPLLIKKIPRAVAVPKISGK